MARMIWKRATDTDYERFIIDSALADADAIALYDMDGDGKIDILTANTLSPNVVSWYKQNSPTSWTRYTIDTVGVEIESMAVFPIAGKTRVITGDQDPGIIRIYTETVQGQPTGTWSRTTLLTGYTWLQNLWAYDLDNDGVKEIIFCHEGSALNEGGVYWLDFTGSDPMNAAHWTIHEMVQHEGAFWTPHSFQDISGSGRGDLVMSARNNTARNPATIPGVYWLARPATVTNAWTLNTIDSRSADWHKVNVGDFFGDGHGKDVIAADLDNAFPIATYRFNSSYARTDITQVDGTRTWNLGVVPAANGMRVDGRDAIIIPHDVGSFIYKYYWSGSQWLAVATEYATENHPLDGWIEWYDIDSDSVPEAVFADSSAIDSKLVWVKVPSGQVLDEPDWTPVQKTSGGYLPIFWLKADSLELAHREPIREYVDVSGHDVVLRQGAEDVYPLYREDIINGLPAMYFNGEAVLLNDDFVMDLTQRTIFVVARQKEEAESNQRILVIAPSTGEDDTASPRGLAWRTGSADGARPDIVGSTSGSYNLVGTDNTLVDLAIWCDRKNVTNSGKLYKNGGTPVATDGTYTEFATASGGGLWLGGRLDETTGELTDDRRFWGDICEILIYPAMLSVEDTNQVGDYLERWGLTWSAIS